MAETDIGFTGKPTCGQVVEGRRLCAHRTRRRGAAEYGLDNGRHSVPRCHLLTATDEMASPAGYVGLHNKKGR